MNSGIKLIIGLSVCGALASSAAGCSSSSSDNGGSGGSVVVVAGSGSTSTAGSGTGGSGSGTAGGSGDLPPGTPITPSMGWVDMGGNTLGIQGALFTYADDTTKMSLMDTIKTGPNNCMSGTAAKVDTKCTPPAGMDCYGVTWGAAMGLNLNQPIDPATMMGVMTPLPYDGSKTGITGFAFDVSGDMVPTAANFRFLINDGASNQYCSPPSKGIQKGPNVFYLKNLIEECWLAAPKPTDLKGDTAVNNMVKIAWQVVTNGTSAVPFNFCIDNIEAITTPAP